MHVKELDRGEMIAVVGGALLIVSLFLAWYTLGNVHTTLGPCKGPNSSCTGWQSQPVIRYVLIVAAAAPVILAYVILRGHALSWPRGELTAIIALIALALTLFVGPIQRPGNPRTEVSLTLGWYMALGGSLLMVAGALLRTQESSSARKPPGVL